MITTIIHAAKITIVVILGYNNKNSKNSSTYKINGGRTAGYRRLRVEGFWLWQFRGQLRRPEYRLKGSGSRVGGRRVLGLRVFLRGVGCIAVRILLLALSVTYICLKKQEVLIFGISSFRGRDDCIWFVTECLAYTLNPTP